MLDFLKTKKPTPAPVQDAVPAKPKVVLPLIEQLREQQKKLEERLARTKKAITMLEKDSDSKQTVERLIKLGVQMKPWFR